MPIPPFMRDVQWTPLEIMPDDKTLPFATHSGVLKLGALEIKCWRLSTGDAVIEEGAIEKLFPGWKDVPGMQEVIASHTPIKFTK